MNKDWYFSDGDFICNFRSAGILIRGNKVLVQSSKKNSKEFALPGGHVKMGETSSDALIREFKEETGADIICNRLVWTEEVFWKWDNRNAHTIAFYYLVTLKNESDISEDFFESHKDNCDIRLKWVTFQEVKKLTIYPRFLKNKLENIVSHIEHFISID